MKRQSLPQISDCRDCGACCTGQAALPIHLVSTNPDFRLPSVTPLPAELAAELRATAERFQRDGYPPDDSPCIWYDADRRQCRHYLHRPTLCRDEVKPGDESCRRWRRDAGIDPVPTYRLVNGRVVRDA